MSQEFKEGIYILKNCATHTVLDLFDGKKDEGTPIQGFKPHGGDNQKWRIKFTGKGNQITIQNVKSKTYVGAASNNIQNSVKVVGSMTPLSFVMVQADKGMTMEVADHRTYVLDLKESNPANETPVIFYNNNATSNQQWHLEKA
ncbi:ricin B lectin domain-containing protein [Rhizoctonia solani]|nr:ricin B lectin domain-containing protein [Rhizoctonia solani]